MDGNDSPNISCGDSYNQNMLTSSQNTLVDSCSVNSDSYIVNSMTSSQNNQVDSFIVIDQEDSYIVDNLTISQNNQVDSFIVIDQQDSYIVNNLTSSQNNQVDSFIVENQDDSYIVNRQPSTEYRQQQIPVIGGRYSPSAQPSPPAWHVSYSRRPPGLPAVRKTIRADNRIAASSELPVLEPQIQIQSSQKFTILQQTC